MRSITAWLTLAALVFLRAASAAHAEANVELLIRGPDGQPISHAAVHVLALDMERLIQTERLTAVPATTDNDGIARIFRPIGLNQLRVLVRGVGFGSTGIFNLKPDETIRPLLAPLMPLSSIEGDVPKEVLLPGTVVGPLRFDLWQPGWIATQAACDENGHFRLDDVICGTHVLRPEAGGQPLGVEAQVAVTPGERVSQVSFQPIEPETDNKPQRFDFHPILNGTVRDLQDKPVSGATVFMLSERTYGHRSQQTIHSTLSDDLGRWNLTEQIPANDHPWMIGVTFVAYKPGYCWSALGMKDWPAGNDRETATKSDHRYKLVLTSATGRLNVTVLKNGNAVPSAVVQVSSDQKPPIWSQTRHSKESTGNQLKSILYPSAVTDEQGIAHFTDLTPGLYDIITTNGDVWAIRNESSVGRARNCGDYAVRRNIAVRPGETCDFSVIISPQDYATKLEVHREDGQRPSEKSLDFVAYFDRGTSNLSREHQEGRCVIDGIPLGLCRLRYSYREHLSSGARRAPPDEEATMVMATSPLLENSQAAVLTAHRYTPRLPSVAIQLQDVGGKPVPGYVAMDREWYDTLPQLAGTADGQGRLQFCGLHEYPHQVEAYIPSLMAPALGFGNSPWPDDVQLIGKAATYQQDFTSIDSGPNYLTLRAIPAAYVRGRLCPPKGHACEDCRVQVDWATISESWLDSLPRFETRYNRQTGEFLLGPLPEGNVRLFAVCRDPSRDWTKCRSVSVDARSDRVVQAELNAAELPKIEDGGRLPVQPLLRSAQDVTGRVLLADERTPAGAARILIVLPESWEPTSESQADVLGWFHTQRLSCLGPRPSHEIRGNVPQSVLVAMLPGLCGATVVPFTERADGRELRVVLPEPIALHGKLTVGGLPIDSRNNQFHVLAAYQGHPKVAKFLSVQASAEADGRFELAGLTPGTYQIQAAMDGIWLSKTVRLAVGPMVDQHEPLTLDIGQPGGGSFIRCVDTQGKPVVGVSASVERPGGPLTSLLWPSAFGSDGAGVIHIPPLEAGVHRARILDSGQELSVKVPALGDENRKQAENRIVLTNDDR